MADPVFHLFPLLPSELQLKIWSHTPVGPRIVEIRSFGSSDQHSLCPLPSVLETCRDSREEVMKQYLKIDCGEQTILINPLLDTLIVLSDKYELFEHLVGLQLRHIAINGSMVESAEAYNQTKVLRHSLAKLSTVETITIVLRTWDREWDSEPHTGDERLAAPETELELAEQERWDSCQYFSDAKEDIPNWNPAIVCAFLKRSKV